MHDSLEDELTPLLGSYLSARLDGQLGKAARGFAESPVREPLQPAARRPNPRRGRLIAAVSVAAASVAVAVWCGFQAGRQLLEVRQATAPQAPSFEALERDPPERDLVGPTRDASTPKPSAIAQESNARGVPPLPDALLPESRLVGRQLQWRTIDEGIVYLDPYTPVRKLRRQRWERVEWFDAARGARVQMVVPREEIQFVAIPST